MVWGIIPAKSKDAKIGDRLINTEAETLTRKASLKRVFQTQRCLIPANGYLERQPTKRGKIPFLFEMADQGMFCMAGVWDRWTHPHLDGELGLDDTGPNLSQVIESFTIIQTKPNAMVGEVHDRMPLIFGSEHYSVWLEPNSDPKFLKALLKPFPGKMECRPVSGVDDVRGVINLA